MFGCYLEYISDDYISTDSTFLNRNLPDGKDTYLKLLPGYVLKGNEDHVWLLMWALYSLKHVGHLWYENWKAFSFKWISRFCTQILVYLSLSHVPLLNMQTSSFAFQNLSKTSWKSPTLLRHLVRSLCVITDKSGLSGLHRGTGR